MAVHGGFWKMTFPRCCTWRHSSGMKNWLDFLLDRGADPSLPDKIHQATACGHAEAAGHEALAARLRDVAARIGQSF